MIAADDIADRLESLMKKRCADLLGLARRAGQAVSGFDKAEIQIKSGKAGVLIEASDGAEGGREKLSRLNRDLPVVTGLTAEELAAPFGRDRAVHVVVDRGRLATSLMEEMTRLARFRGIGTEADAKET